MKQTFKKPSYYLLSQAMDGDEKAIEKIDVYKRQVVRLVAPFQQGKEHNMEFIREDCIYARQSVDRKDSISIESQIDFCKYELDVYKRQPHHTLETAPSSLQSPE